MPMVGYMYVYEVPGSVPLFHEAPPQKAGIGQVNCTKCCPKCCDTWRPLSAWSLPTYKRVQRKGKNNLQHSGRESLPGLELARSRSDSAYQRWLVMYMYAQGFSAWSQNDVWNHKGLNIHASKSSARTFQNPNIMPPYIAKVKKKKYS